MFVIFRENRVSTMSKPYDPEKDDPYYTVEAILKTRIVTNEQVSNVDKI